MSTEALPASVAAIPPVPDRGPRGRVRKMVFISKDGDEMGRWESQQIPEDPFVTDRANFYRSGLKRPPYKLEMLQEFRDMSPVHGACIEQRAIDIVGAGVDFELTPGPRSADEATQERQEEAAQAELTMIRARWEGLAGQKVSMLRLLRLVREDYETTSMGYLEVARDRATEKSVRQLFHIPSHTMRPHKDGKRFAQIRGNRIRWMPEYGSGLIIDRNTGKECGPDDPARANEVLVFKAPSTRSTLYGTPHYIKALGEIMLSLAARDYNLRFFQNGREPRWVIIVTNLSDDEGDELEETFRIDLDEPHKNLYLEFTNDVKVDFQKLTQDQNDASFIQLRALCNSEILLAHRVPSDRIGMTRVGPLGGNVVEGADRVYKDGVVRPEQELWAHQLDDFVRKEFGVIYHKLVLVELDLTSEAEDIDTGIALWESGIGMLSEARERAGLTALDPDDERANKFRWEVIKTPALAHAPRPLSQRQPHGQESQLLDALSEQLGERLGTLDRMMDKFAEDVAPSSSGE